MAGHARQPRPRHKLESDQSRSGEIGRPWLRQRHIRTDHERRQRKAGQRSRQIRGGLGKEGRWEVEMWNRYLELRPSSVNASTRSRGEKVTSGILDHGAQTTDDGDYQLEGIGGRSSCDASPGLVELAPPVQRASGIGT